MHIVHEDIFKSDADVIVHQVNCQGAMNSGIAKQVRERYPIVFKCYEDMCKKYKDNRKKLLGKVLYVDCGDKMIANMFSQYNFGYNGERFTNYEAFEECLKDINIKMFGKTIAIPYNIGCCRGGGDWSIVSQLIEDCLVDCDVVFYQCDKG